MERPTADAGLAVNVSLILHPIQFSEVESTQSRDQGLPRYGFQPMIAALRDCWDRG
jgi:hypothetical protein